MHPPSGAPSGQGPMKGSARRRRRCWEIHDWWCLIHGAKTRTAPNAVNAEAGAEKLTGVARKNERPDNRSGLFTQNTLENQARHTPSSYPNSCPQPVTRTGDAPHGSVLISFNVGPAARLNRRAAPTLHLNQDTAHRIGSAELLIRGAGKSRGAIPRRRRARRPARRRSGGRRRVA